MQIETPSNTIIALPITQRLLSVLQDGEWHSLSEFDPSIAAVSSLRTALSHLNKQGHQVESKQVNPLNNAKQYRLIGSPNRQRDDYDVVDVAILGRLYHYNCRKKLVQSGRIYMDLSVRFQLEEPRAVQHKLRKLYNRNYVTKSKKQIKPTGKPQLYWKISEVGIKLLKTLAGN